MDPNLEGTRPLREQIIGTLGVLTDVEREVILRRFGLEDGQPQNLSEVCAGCGLTEAQVRQLEAKALETLQSGPTGMAS